MEKIEYPKWKYHAELEAVIVPHRAAEIALGAGWFDSPADVCAPIPVESESEKIAQAPAVEAPLKRTKRGKSA